AGVRRFSGRKPWRGVVRELLLRRHQSGPCCKWGTRETVEPGRSDATRAGNVSSYEKWYARRKRTIPFSRTFFRIQKSGVKVGKQQDEPDGDESEIHARAKGRFVHAVMEKFARREPADHEGQAD